MIPLRSSVKGVLAPTQAASSQWALGRFLWARFHLVRPPVPTSTGSPVVTGLWYSAHRLAFTAAVSFKGCFAFCWISGCPNSAAVRFPLASLQGWQANVRLLTRLEPPRVLGAMYSTSSGTPLAPQ